MKLLLFSTVFLTITTLTCAEQIKQAEQATKTIIEDWETITQSHKNTTDQNDGEWCIFENKSETSIGQLDIITLTPTSGKSSPKGDLPSPKWNTETEEIKFDTQNSVVAPKTQSQELNQSQTPSHNLESTKSVHLDISQSQTSTHTSPFLPKQKQNPPKKKLCSLKDPCKNCLEGFSKNRLKWHQGGKMCSLLNPCKQCFNFLKSKIKKHCKLN